MICRVLPVTYAISHQWQVQPMDACRGNCVHSCVVSRGVLSKMRWKPCKATAHAQLAVVVAAPDLKEVQGSQKVDAGIWLKFRAPSHINIIVLSCSCTHEAMSEQGKSVAKQCRVSGHHPDFSVCRHCSGELPSCIYLRKLQTPTCTVLPLPTILGCRVVLPWPYSIDQPHPGNIRA